MARIPRRVLSRSLLGLVAFGLSVSAQRQTVTISEPAPVKVEGLLKQADLVAVVRIVSGDTEHYTNAVYKAEVLQPFKGVETGKTVYFGPFVKFGLGGEYLVFLRHSEKGLEPKQPSVASGLDYGPIPSFYLVMYEGYGALPIEYDCVFDGKEIAQRCDYGIKVNTHQVVLPQGLRTYPSSAKGSFSEDTKWVRKTVFLSFMQTLSK
jgi:hypothetical protein